MTPTAFCVIAWSLLVVLVLGCVVSERRNRDCDTDRTGPRTGQPVDYWEAEVESWLAQLAELRSLETLPEGDDRASVNPVVTSVASAHTDPAQSASAAGSTTGCNAASEPSAATTLPA